MTPSLENETCEETSKLTRERVNQNEPAWKHVREKQRTAGSAARESGEGREQCYYDVDERRTRKGDKRRRRPSLAETQGTRRAESLLRDGRHPLHERGSRQTPQERKAWSS